MLDEMFFKLSTRIKSEIAFQKQIYQLLGSLDVLLSSSSADMAAGVSPSAGQQEMVSGGGFQ